MNRKAWGFILGTIVVLGIIFLGVTLFLGQYLYQLYGEVTQEVTWLATVVKYVMLALLPVLAFLFVLWMYKHKYGGRPTTTTPPPGPTPAGTTPGGAAPTGTAPTGTPATPRTPWVEFWKARWDWIKDNEIAVIGFATLHIMALCFLFDFWVIMARHWPFWFDQIVLAVIYVLLRKNNKGKKLVFTFWAWAALLMLIVCNVSYLIPRLPGIQVRYFPETIHPEASVAIDTMPKDEEVVAPVGHWSEWVQTMHGETLRPHGHIQFRYVDGHGNIHVDESTSTGHMGAIIEMAKVQFQSRTDEPVTVTVSR